MKEICLNDPDKKLFLNTSKGKNEIAEIFYHVKMLTYEQRPNYGFIRTKLEELMTKEYFKISYINNTMLYDLPDKYYTNKTESPTKELEANLGKSSKNVINSSLTNTNNLINFPFATAFENYSNLLDSSISKNNILNSTGSRKLLYNMKHNNNDTNFNNINNLNQAMTNELLNPNRLSLFNTANNGNQMTRKKRKRDEMPCTDWIGGDEGLHEMFKKDPSVNNLNPNIAMNNLPPLNQIPTPFNSNPNTNQIFIINQFNKGNMTDLEKCLLNYLIPKPNINVNVSNNYQTSIPNEPLGAKVAPTTPTGNTKDGINNADKLLINNIKEKLKPTATPLTPNSKQPQTFQQEQIPSLNLNNIPNMNPGNPYGMNALFSNNLLHVPNNNMLNNNMLFTDPNSMLVNNLANMTGQNPLYNNINNTLNSLNNISSADIYKNLIKLYETSPAMSNNVDFSKLNYGYSDMNNINKLLTSNLEAYSNIFNNNKNFNIIEQLKQNMGNYNHLLNEYFVNSYRAANTSINPTINNPIPPQVLPTNVQKRRVKLFKIEKQGNNK
jgi:hypothetical protein